MNWESNNSLAIVITVNPIYMKYYLLIFMKGYNWQKYCPSSCVQYTVKEMEVLKMFFRIVSPTQLTFIKCWLIVSLRKQFLIGWKFDLTNQEYYSDLGNDASSVWNFCGRENQCWRCKISLAVFSRKQIVKFNPQEYSDDYRCW